MNTIKRQQVRLRTLFSLERIFIRVFGAYAHRLMSREISNTYNARAIGSDEIHRASAMSHVAFGRPGFNHGWYNVGTLHPTPTGEEGR